MKSFFQLRESAKQLSEKTMELAGVTLQNMEHCPGAVSAFKQNLKDGASEADVAKAAKAVDAYLAIEDKAKKSGATEDDLEEMEGLVDQAKEIIDELGLEGHTYHDMHIERVEDIINGEDDDDDEDEMNEAVDPEETGGEAELEMAMNQVKQMRHYLDGIEKMVKGDGDMEEWVQNKLTKAADYLKSVYGYNTGKPDNMDEAYTSFKTGEEKSAFEAGKKAFRSGKKYADNPYKDANQKLAWSKGHNQAKARKLGVREKAEIDEAMTASQHRMAMLDKIRKSGVVKQGSMSKNEAMKKPSDKELHKTLAMTKNKEQGIAALMKNHKMDKGTARAHMKRLMGEETIDEVLDTPKAMDSYKAKAQYSRDRAAKSAVATNLRSKDKPQREHPAKDLKTMAKRTAGLRMADRAATRKTLDKLRGKK